MNKFYVRDGKNVAYFKTVSEVVYFLEKAVVLKLNTNRKDWMQHIMDLGHGLDDPSGKNFVESLASQIETGVVQRDGKHVRCSIFEATVFSSPEYGD